MNEFSSVYLIHAIVTNYNGLFFSNFVCLFFFHRHSKGFGALAALKRKRKKFSKSRNTSPVLEPSAPSKVKLNPNKTNR